VKSGASKFLETKRRDGVNKVIEVEKLGRTIEIKR
jgi:hypothetical protein